MAERQSGALGIARSVPDRGHDRGYDLWKLATAAGIVLLVGLALWCSSDVGVTYDELLQRNYGKRILFWYSSGFHNRAALTYSTPLFEYGGIFEAPAQLLVWLLPFDWVTTRHALTGLCAVLGVLATASVASRLSGSRAGFFAGALLALTPVFWGHGLFNSKDIPFAAATAWALDGCVALALGAQPARWRTVWLWGIATGAALGVRAGGMFILGYPVMAVLGRFVIDRYTQPTAARSRVDTSLVHSLLRLVSGFALTWLVMLSAWPWAQLAPLQRPFEALQLAAQFSWMGNMLFNGSCVHSQHLPRSYLPIWFGVALPEVYALALLCMPVLIVNIWRQANGELRWSRLLGFTLLAGAVIMPLAVAIIARVVVYDAERHFLFILPPLAAVCGCALAEVGNALYLPRALRLGVAVAATCLALLVASDMLALHPYEYVYFNRFVGGLPGAAQRFETDYWGASYREGLTWLVQHVKPEPGRKLRVSSCNCYGETRHYLQGLARVSDRFTPTLESETADIFLSTTRNRCHLIAGDVLHRVMRQGAPLLYVIRRPGVTASVTP